MVCEDDRFIEKKELLKKTVDILDEDVIDQILLILHTE